MKEARIIDGEKTISSIIDAGKAEQLQAKEPSWTTFSLHIQKETQNGLKAKCKT